VVLTSRPQSLPAGVEGVASLEQALKRCADAPELCVIGGAEVFRSTLPRADRMELTQVHATPPGDVWFPEFAMQDWREVARMEHAADERHPWAMTFVTLDRVP